MPNVANTSAGLACVTSRKLKSYTLRSLKKKEIDMKTYRELQEDFYEAEETYCSDFSMKCMQAISHIAEAHDDAKSGREKSVAAHLQVAIDYIESAMHSNTLTPNNR